MITQAGVYCRTLDDGTSFGGKPSEAGRRIKGGDGPATKVTITDLMESLELGGYLAEVRFREKCGESQRIYFILHAKEALCFYKYDDAYVEELLPFNAGYNPNDGVFKYLFVWHG